MSALLSYCAQYSAEPRETQSARCSILCSWVQHFWVIWLVQWNAVMQIRFGPQLVTEQTNNCFVYWWFGHDVTCLQVLPLCDGDSVVAIFLANTATLPTVPTNSYNLAIIITLWMSMHSKGWLLCLSLCQSMDRNISSLSEIGTLSVF